MTRTAYYWDHLSLEHDTGEHAEGVQRADALRPERMADLVPNLDARSVEDKDAARWVREVHEQTYHDFVKHTCETGGGLLDSGDTHSCERSYDAALGSVNAVLTAADAVMSGEVENAFSAMRPPGHHALPSRAMGFCLFNNVAILARYLEQKYRVANIGILDFDVHHGNGTQDIFWRETDIFFCSLHQFPLWPGSGLARDEGDGPGMGMTLNIPIAPATSEADYLREFESKALDRMQTFQPDFLIVSAGFDAHIADPLAELRLTEDGYAKMTRGLREVAAECCNGRMISVLEGGYNLDALQKSVAAHLGALME